MQVKGNIRIISTVTPSEWDASPSQVIQQHFRSRFPKSSLVTAFNIFLGS